MVLELRENWLVYVLVDWREDSSSLDFALEDHTSADGCRDADRFAHERGAAGLVALARLNPGRGLGPSLLLLILHDEVVTHDHKVSVVFTMGHFAGHDCPKGVQAGDRFALTVMSFDLLRFIKEAKELH